MALLALALLALALPWYLAGHGLDLPPLLLALVGGWALGFWFVNATLRMRRERLGAVCHVAVAVTGGVLLWAVTAGRPPFVESLPGSGRAVALLVQMASIPALGWIWLGLLGRLSASVSRPRTEMLVPNWSREDGGSIVRFPAVPMRLRELYVMIVAVVLLGGGAVIALMIVLDIFVFGPRMLLVLLGLIVGFPAYLILSESYRRRTVAASVWFDSDRIRVAYGAEVIETPLASIRMLRWRTDSEEARIELHTDVAEISLVAGLARVPKGTAAALPSLPRFVRRSLQLAGLVVRHERKGTTTWVREAA